jgi:hypothetical protein
MELEHQQQKRYVRITSISMYPQRVYSNRKQPTKSTPIHHAPALVCPYIIRTTHKTSNVLSVLRCPRPNLGNLVWM